MHALLSALRSQVDVDIQSTDSNRSPPTERGNISIKDKVGELMNHKLHTLASSLIDSDQSQPFDYQTLDIGKQMAW